MQPSSHLFLVGRSTCCRKLDVTFEKYRATATLLALGLLQVAHCTRAYGEKRQAASTRAHTRVCSSCWRFTSTTAVTRSRYVTRQGLPILYSPAGASRVRAHSAIPARAGVSRSHGTHPPPPPPSRVCASTIWPASTLPVLSMGAQPPEAARPAANPPQPRVAEWIRVAHASFRFRHLVQLPPAVRGRVAEAASLLAWRSWAFLAYSYARTSTQSGRRT